MKKITLLQDFSLYEAGSTIEICSMTASNLVNRKVAEYSAADAELSAKIKKVDDTDVAPEIIEVEQVEQSEQQEEIQEDLQVNQPEELTEVIVEEKLPEIKAEIPAANVSKKQHSKTSKNK